MERGDSDDCDQGSAVRVCLPRRELRHAGHSQGRSLHGERSRGRSDEGQAVTCAPHEESELEPGGSQMRGSACRTSALAVTMLFAWCIVVAAQDYAGREKLRAQSNEFRKEVIRVTDGVYVAVGYSASNVIVIQGDGGSIIVDTSTHPLAASGLRTAFCDLPPAPLRPTL